MKKKRSHKTRTIKHLHYDSEVLIKKLLDRQITPKAKQNGTPDIKNNKR